MRHPTKSGSQEMGKGLEKKLLKQAGIKKQ